MQLEIVEADPCDMKFVFEPERTFPRAVTHPKKDGVIQISFGKNLKDSAHAAH